MSDLYQRTDVNVVKVRNGRHRVGELIQAMREQGALVTVECMEGAGDDPVCVGCGVGMLTEHRAGCRDTLDGTDNESAETPTTCEFRDLTCPCNDGDQCHYT